MMFLQFFVWGAWYTSIAVYMTNHGMEKLTHWPYTVNPIAAIVAPFFLGLVADRYFATEKVLGVLHLLGGVVMFAVPQATGAPAAFILLLLVYNLCYMPTLGLANSLAFHHIHSQEQQFPLIRVFGTIGWIVAGLSIDFVLGPMIGSGPVPEQTALPIYTAEPFAPARARSRSLAPARSRSTVQPRSTRSYRTRGSGETAAPENGCDGTPGYWRGRA